MVILMAIAFRLRRGGNDNLNLTPNDNPILTPPIAGTGVIPHRSVIIQFQCLVPIITNSDPWAIIDPKRIFVAAWVNQKAADQRQLEFPNFTTNVDTATGRQTEWSVAQRRLPACGLYCFLSLCVLLLQIQHLFYVIINIGSWYIINKNWIIVIATCN